MGNRNLIPMRIAALTIGSHRSEEGALRKQAIAKEKAARKAGYSGHAQRFKDDIGYRRNCERQDIDGDYCKDIISSVSDFQVWVNGEPPSGFERQQAQIQQEGATGGGRGIVGTGIKNKSKKGAGKGRGAVKGAGKGSGKKQ
jgi:hypothetical protein